MLRDDLVEDKKPGKADLVHGSQERRRVHIGVGRAIVLM